LVIEYKLNDVLEADIQVGVSLLTDIDFNLGFWDGLLFDNRLQLKGGVE
jgi:hypothetical protein